MPAAVTAHRTALTVHNPVVQKPISTNIKWVADEKLYKDNDFVNEHHLSRHCIGLSGMKFTDEEIEELASKIRKMKEDGTHLCCSIGFLTEKQALMLKEAGLDRINHNLNSSRAYYSHICSTHTFEQRVQEYQNASETWI